MKEKLYLNFHLLSHLFSDTRGLEVCGDGGRSASTVRVLRCYNSRDDRDPDGRAPHFRIRRPGRNYRALPRQIDKFTGNRRHTHIRVELFLNFLTIKKEKEKGWGSSSSSQRFFV